MAGFWRQVCFGGDVALPKRNFTGRAHSRQLRGSRRWWQEGLPFPLIIVSITVDVFQML
jgi:hypothetical protein